VNEAAPTLADIEAAERLFDVSYSPAERLQMVNNLEAQMASTRLRRQVKLANNVPMASTFDPRLPTFSMPAPQGFFRRSTAPAKPLPASDEDIAFSPVTQLSAWIASGVLSSRRLTDIYLARIAALNPKLECYAMVTPELARAEADAADALLRGGVNLGPLHGMPYGLKDLFDTKGIVTGWGAEPFRDRVPDADATIVRKLRAAGAVLLGKTTLGALAYNDIWYGGQTRNPWNLNEGSSGSSAGSASATGGGLCAFSIGTETMGSITSPSQRCGTTGLRPTFGRVSRAGGMTLCWSLDKVGPICRSVEDTALVLAAINGGDIADRGSINASFSFDAEADISGLRVGYLAEAFGEGATDVDHAALAAMRRLGVEVVEVALPDLPYNTLVNVCYAEAAAAFEDLTLSNVDDTLKWQDDGAWPNTFRRARFISAIDHIQLDRLRYQVMVALDGVFSKVDAMIGPFQTGPMLVATNCTGHPCVHLRAGFQELRTREMATFGLGKLSGAPEGSTGKTYTVPQGISLWGRLFEEGPILSLGMALERELGVVDRRPTFAE
jgi:Asp-tRNA(Asn)/Glu-tRNA(Gln) amidotransferase A subunit family amidase